MMLLYYILRKLKIFRDKYLFAKNTYCLTRYLLPLSGSSINFQDKCRNLYNFFSSAFPAKYLMRERGRGDKDAFHAFQTNSRHH